MSFLITTYTVTALSILVEAISYPILSISFHILIFLIPGTCLAWVLDNRSYLNHENSANSVFLLYLNKD
jgi:hypothetical protein